MKFTKMQGAGNDFIIIDDRKGRFSREQLSELAAKLCPRRVSVGADGLMAVRGAEAGGDFAMLFFNADGSLGEMCGNGARCIARWGYDHGVCGEEQHIETTAGPVSATRLGESEYRVRLNDPGVLRPYYNVELRGHVYDCAYVELGDPGIPHAIVRLDDFGDVGYSALWELGSLLRSHPAFPKGANVTFWRKHGRDSFAARTFERGVEDFTLACGTGAGSLVAAATARGLCGGKNVTVNTDGGTLKINLSAEGSWVHDIYLTGPAVTVYEGETPE